MMDQHGHAASWPWCRLGLCLGSLWCALVVWRLLVTVPARVAPWGRWPLLGRCSRSRRRLPCFCCCFFPPRPASRRRQQYGSRSLVPARLMVALGSGGHTGEMCQLMSAVGLAGNPAYNPVVFVSSRTDAVSERRVKNVRELSGVRIGVCISWLLRSSVCVLTLPPSPALIPCAPFRNVAS